MGSDDYGHYADWKHWDPNDFGKYSEEDGRYYEKELRSSGIESIAGQCVLEIGFGNGSFAGWAIANGASYVGIEAIPNLVAQAKKSGIEAYDASDDITTIFPEKKFHLVVAFDVIEHMTVVEIQRLLTRIRRALHSRGVVVARVPSGDSPFSRAIQYGDLTHKTILGSSAVHQLIAPLDYELVHIRNSEFVYIGSSISSTLRRLIVLIIRKVLYPIISYAFMGGGSKVLAPNMLFILRPRNTY